MQGEDFTPALLRATDDFTASMVVTQSIGYYIYQTAWFARDRLGRSWTATPI
jgi:hypothetical protein